MVWSVIGLSFYECERGQLSSERKDDDSEGADGDDVVWLLSRSSTSYDCKGLPSERRWFRDDLKGIIPVVKIC
jgi:hypothetical protein